MQQNIPRYRRDRNNIVFGIPDMDVEKEIANLYDEVQRRPVVVDAPKIELQLPPVTTVTPPVDPVPTTGLAAWWDFSDTSYWATKVGTGTQVYWTWGDKSASNIDLAVPNDNTSPNWYENPSSSIINGVASVFFNYTTASQRQLFRIDDGGANTTTSPVNGTFTSLSNVVGTTIFAVCKFASSTNGSLFLDIIGSTAGTYRRIKVADSSDGGNVEATTGNFNTTDGVEGTSSLLDGSAHIVAVVFQDTAPYITIRVDGVQEVASSPSTVPVGEAAPKLYLGAYVGGGDLDLGEVLVYGSALTLSQVQQVEGYLSTKWGI